MPPHVVTDDQDRSMKIAATRTLAALAVVAAAPAAARAQTDTTTTPVRTDSAAAPVQPAPVAAMATDSAVVTDDAGARPLAVGQTVRVTADGQEFTGKLMRVTPDSLVLVAPNRLHRLRRADVTAAERQVNSGARGRAILRGAGLGALGGAALGGLASLALTKDPAGRGFITADGLLIGALVGIFIAPRSTHPVWERVDPSIGAAPAALPPPPAP
jgi:hypothetical protein